MLLPTAVRRWPALIALPILFILWLVFLFHSGHPFIRTLTSYAEEKYRHGMTGGVSRDEFIISASSVSIPYFDAAALQSECSGGPWCSDLVLRCPPAYGGLTSVRQKILTCLRWAIAWRMAVILPEVRPRLDSPKGVVHAYSQNAVGLDHFFDQDLFIARLHEGCPQITLFESVEAIGSPEKLEFVGGIDRVRHPDKEQMAPYGKKWVEEHRGGRGNISIFDFGNGKLATEYEICNDGTAFADSFGQLLVFRNDTKRLAAEALYELNTRFKLKIDPDINITKGAYLGVHLRTSSDASAYGFLSFESQAQSYKEYAATSKLSAIYVASGNLSSVALFADIVSPIPVVTKLDLLSGADLELLNSLSWDQQAEVDHMMLLKSSMYVGMASSGFSWVIAAARRAVSEGGTCGVTGLTPVGEDSEKGIAMKDELSEIVGEPSKFNLGTMQWP